MSGREFSFADRLAVRAGIPKSGDSPPSQSARPASPRDTVRNILSDLETDLTKSMNSSMTNSFKYNAPVPTSATPPRTTGNPILDNMMSGSKREYLKELSDPTSKDSKLSTVTETGQDKEPPFGRKRSIHDYLKDLKDIPDPLKARDVSDPAPQSEIAPVATSPSSGKRSVTFPDTSSQKESDVANTPSIVSGFSSLRSTTEKYGSGVGWKAAKTDNVVDRSGESTNSPGRPRMELEKPKVQVPDLTARHPLARLDSNSTMRAGHSGSFGSERARTEATARDVDSPVPLMDYGLLDTVDVRQMNKLEQKEMLERFGMNTVGKPGDIQRRLCLLKELKGEALTFDLKHTEIAQRAVRRLGDRLSPKVLFECSEPELEKFLQSLQAHNEVDVDELQSLCHCSKVYKLLLKYERIIFGDRPSLGFVDISQWKVRKLEETFLDLRPPALRMSHEDIAMDKKWSRMLGYTRESIISKSLSHNQLQDIMKAKNIWRDEYENEDHLRRNMVLLLTKLMKEEKKREALAQNDDKSEVNELFGGQCNLEDRLKFIDTMNPGRIEELAHQLGLFPDFTPADYEMNYDLVEAKLKSYVERLHQKQQKAELSLEDIHRSLPTLDYDRNYARGSCGIVRNGADLDPVIRCKVSRVGDSEILEIGIRSDGYFSWGEEDEFERAFKVEWHGLVSDAGVRERAKKLDTFLESRTPAGETLHYLHLVVGEDEVFPIDISRNTLEAKHTFPYGIVISCKPLDLVDDEGVPFKRMILQFKTFNQDIRSIIEKMAQCVDLDTQSPYRFGESGDVLAQALELQMQYLQWAKRPHTEFEEGSLSDRLGPSLLHYTSSYLKTHIFPNLNALLREKWEKELDVRNKYTPQVQVEAKRILLDMLLSAPEDKHVAILTPVQLHYVYEDITKRTHHLHNSIYVERSNLHVILRSLTKLNAIAGTIFVFLHLTGNISPFDLSRLLDQTKKGSLRIFMTFSAALLSSLGLIGKLQDVRVSQHAATSPDYSTATYHQYSMFTDVGVVILNNERYFEMHAALLTFPQLEGLIDENRKHIEWAERETSWRAKPLPRERCDDHSFAIIVTRDTAVVRRHYEQLVDAGDPTLSLIDCKVDDIDAKLNHVCGGSVDASSWKNASVQSLQSPTLNKSAGSVPCLVVLNANMLSSAHRRNIASRACQEGMRFVFVVPSFNPQHITMKFDDAHNQTRFLRGTVWHASPSLWDLQQTTEEVCKARQVDSSVTSLVTQKAVIVFRVLRLIFGSQVTLEGLSPIVNGLLSNRLFDEMEKLLGFAQAPTAQGTEITVLKEILSVILAYFNDNLPREASTLQEAITLLCLSRVLAYETMEYDITFEQFVCSMPVCEWLSQRHRIEAYIRSVLMDSTDPPTHLFSGWQYKDHLLARYPTGFNVHDLTIYSYLRMDNDRRPAIDIPSYKTTSKDVIVSHEEMILQTCIQRQELNWIDIASQWRTFPYGVDFLATMLSVYHQPLKLLANVGRKNLYHMMENISRATHGDVIDRLGALISESNELSLSLIQDQPTVAPFISTLKWSLISSGHVNTIDQKISFDDTDLMYIIREQIPITVRRKEGNSPSFIIPVILRLPGPPDILYNQVGLREYFLSMKERDALDILENKDFDIGAALLDFVFHANVRRCTIASVTYAPITPQALGEMSSPTRGGGNESPHSRTPGRTGQRVNSINMQGPPPFVNHLDLSVFIQWLENAQSLVDTPQARSGTFMQLVSRFNPSAFALLLSKANTLPQTDLLLELVFAYLRAKDLKGQEAADYIRLLAQSALQRSESLTQIIHFLLNLPTELIPSKVDHPFIDLLMRSMRDRDLGALMDMYCREDDLPFLPVETNNALRQLYITYFQDSNVNNPDLVLNVHVPFHFKALSTYGNTCLFQTICTNRKTMDACRLLIFVLWAMNPFQMCPIYPESEMEKSLLRHLVQHEEVGFEAKVARNISTVSSFALYLCFPYYLDHQTLSDFDMKMNVKPIQESAYLIAQKGHTKWPSYQIRTHHRPLPMDLIAKYDTTDFQVKKQPRGHSVERLDFDISSGVSIRLMSKNLNAVAAMMSVDHNDTRIFLGNVLLAWFAALGISELRIRKWSLPIASRDDDALLASSPVSEFLDWIPDKPVNETAYTLHPLPSFLDLRVLKDKSCYRLFGGSFEEAAYTLQYFETFLYSVPGAMDVIKEEGLIMPSGATALVAENQSQGTVVCSRTPEYLNLPGIASQVFGKCIRRFVDTLEYAHNSRYDLGQLENFVHPFTIALAAVQEENPDVGDQNVLDVMMLRFLEAAKVGKDVNPKVREGLIHMALALRIGIFNSQLQDRLLQNCLKARFAIAEQAVNEMIWCVEHKFITMPNLDSVQGTGVTVQRHDELPALSHSSISGWQMQQCHAKLPQNVLASKDEKKTPEKKDAVTRALRNTSDNTKGAHSYKKVFISQSKLHNEGGNKSKTNRPTELFHNPDYMSAPAECIHCDDLLEIRANRGYGILRVRPGRECFLMRLRPGVLQLSRSSKQQDLGERVVASFPNNGMAWEYLQDLPPLSTLICDGFMMKKSMGGQWTLSFAIYDDSLNLDELDKGAAHLFRPWRVLDCRCLFAFELMDEVVEFLFLICRYVYAVYTECETDVQRIPASDILVWFRDHPEHSRLEQIQDDLSVVILDVLDELHMTRANRVTMESLIRKTVVTRNVRNLFQNCTALFGGMSFFDALVRHSLQMLSRRSNNQLRAVLLRNMDDLNPILGTPAMKSLNKIMKIMEEYVDPTPEEEEQLAELRVVPAGEDVPETDSPLLKETRSVTPTATPKASEMDVSGNSSLADTLKATSPRLKMEELKLSPSFSTSVTSPSDDEESEEPEPDPHWAHVYCEKKPRPGYAVAVEYLKPKPHFGDTDDTGFGLHIMQPGYIVAGIGSTPPLVVATLDQSLHKNYYHPVEGKVLSYILHPRLLARVNPEDQEAKGSKKDYILQQFLRWLVDVLRSPLSNEWKHFFLNLCTGNIAEPPPEVATDTTSGTKIVAYCLARACVIPHLRQYLSRATGYEKLSTFCERKMMRYGVYFCDCGTNRQLRKSGIRFETVDLGAYYASGTTTEDEFYLKIINMFAEFTTHVYVQGLPSLGDLFLKWCAEYTERCPWRFIYFEGTDSTWNFIENRDRCIYKLFTSPLELQRKTQTTRVYYTRLREAGAAKLRWPQLIDLHFPPPRDGAPSVLHSEEVIETKYVGEWEAQLEAISDRQELLLLLVSPPGAGKTHLVETTIMAQAEHNERYTQRMDCSNDELVELSLTYILNRKFPRDSKALLVADEFHMLDVQAKEELIRWCTERQHWLQVILIANRSDENDQKILSAARRQYTSEDAVQLLNCRLRIEKVLNVYRLENPLLRFESYITVFFRACRSLFSDDSISLRNLQPIHELLCPDGSIPKPALVSLLLSKLPHIGVYCAQQFVSHVDSIYKQYGNVIDETSPIPQTNSPLQLLVSIGLLDRKGILCSYKEFVGRLENAHKGHPSIRLAAWCTYICHSVGIEPPPLECLGQLEVIDQVGFPLIVSESGSGGLESCLSFFKSGDYTDLEWMAEAIVHGHAMNWAQVKECWHHHYISDPTAFTHLLSVCTDPESVLNALSPKNLCLLINSSDVTLSYAVLEHYNLSDSAADTEESPYFAAAWFVLRNTERVGKDYTDAWKDYITKTSVMQVLRWASEYAFHLLDVVDDPEGREEYIQSLLVSQTNSLAAEIRRDKDTQNQIISLWSNIFAPFLTVGSEGIPYDIAYMVAKSQHPPKSSWPPFVRTICNMAHGYTDPGEVDQLYDHPFFKEYLTHDQEDWYIPSEMLSTFLSLDNSQLSKRWQLRILTSSHVVLDESFNTLKHKKNLMEGLKALGDREDLKAKGSLRAELLEMYDRLYPTKTASA